MKKRRRLPLICGLVLVAFLHSIAETAENAHQHGHNMTTAKGHFEVDLSPQNDGDFDAGRMTIAKEYHGDLGGMGKGQMLSLRAAVKDSAAYVAIETVSGSLQGRSGTFALQHVGAMARGQSSLSITIVPDSGTGQLEGITGEMSIDKSDGEHVYTLRYAFDSKREE